ncbi:MAG: nicotinate phosphoribosyltransferase [Actinomycetota bacterium]|nr:nicotinate phosphoribosyltransferase [Actinomycetota bacterium]
MAPASVFDGVLATDQYQLTMAQLYFEEGLADRTAQFDYFFRSNPDYGTHQAGYCIAARIDWLLEWMEQVRFGEQELQILREQTTADGVRRFSTGFLDWLSEHGDFSAVEVDAVAEGRVVHPNVPVAIVRGPLAMAQILETAFLNRLNYPTLVATKASRVKDAARGRPVLEFGMRRGPESGVHAGGRGALIGGADATSNLAVSTAIGIDAKGTHAHSMVQVFMALGIGELEAFRRFARLYPDECTLLVDTIDVLDSGVPNAITVFQELAAAGHHPAGIRIDSGDLAHLAIRASALLDEAGFGVVPIVLSSDLDELVIWQILSQIDTEAARYGLDPAGVVGRMVFGVGTRLITSHGDPALGGVYKLVAVQDAAGGWLPAIKVSADVAKVAVPGAKQVYRLYSGDGLATADVIAVAGEDPFTGETIELFHPHREVNRRLATADITEVEELLGAVFRGGHRVGPSPTLAQMQERRERDLDRLHPGVRRLVNPHLYHVSLTAAMKRRQRELVRAALDPAG